MAQHDTSAPAMDYPEHERTYDRFVTFTKWGTIVVCGIVVFMAITLL